MENCDMKQNAIFADFDAAVRAMRSGDYKPSVKIGRDEVPEAKDGPFLGVGSKYASQDLISSVHWLEMAADGGLPEAQQLLGVMLSRGDVIWPDPVASCAYHRLAAVQG